MNLALLMLLALLWSVVLLPSALRSRRKSLHHSMGGFARAMQILAGSEPPSRRDTRVVFVPADPRRIVAPPRGAELARERRRRTLVGLLTTVGISASLALLLHGVFTVLAVASSMALVAFVAALRQMAQQERRARTLVRLDDRRHFEDRQVDDDRWAVGV